MNTTACTRESEVLQAAVAGRWPAGCSEELAAHASTCVTCGEIAAIASAFRREISQSGQVAVPPAGQIWWRAAIRARGEDACAAARPMLWLQALVGAAAAGLAAGAMSMLWPMVEGTARRFLPLSAVSWHDALPLVLLIAVGLLATPIAFYFAVPRE